MSDVAYLLRVEGVNIGATVLDTQDLSTMRGGSLMLLAAIRAIDKAFGDKPGWAAITTGASAGLFSFLAADDRAAGVLRREVEDYLSGIGAKVPDGKLAAAMLQGMFVVDVCRAGASFTRDKERLLALNRWRQMQTPSVKPPGPSGNGVCRVDQVRPAGAKLEWYKGEAGVAMSESVSARRTFGKRQKSEFYAGEVGELGPDFPDFARDLGTIALWRGENGEPRHPLCGKMAVIYLDGNDFTRIQNAYVLTKGQEAQTEFDAKVKEWRREMLLELLCDLSGLEDAGIAAIGFGDDAETNGMPSKNYLRLETLLWGGDEISWVVPAWLGWRVLTLFYRFFREGLGDQPRSIGSDTLHHAAGIVFCHHNAPINRIGLLARELADLAKEKDRKDSLFSYEVLEAFDHIGQGVADYRQRHLGDVVDPARLVLSASHMVAIDQAMGVLKTHLPRRRARIALETVLDATAPENSIELLMSVIRRDHGAEADDALTVLADVLGGEKAMWVHIDALWDYVGLEALDGGR